MTDPYRDHTEDLADAFNAEVKTMAEARDIIRGIMPTESAHVVNEVAETLLFVSEHTTPQKHKSARPRRSSREPE
jgi:hypothetical protein